MVLSIDGEHHFSFWIYMDFSFLHSLFTFLTSCFILYIIWEDPRIVESHHIAKVTKGGERRGRGGLGGRERCQTKAGKRNRKKTPYVPTCSGRGLVF